MRSHMVLLRIPRVAEEFLDYVHMIQMNVRQHNCINLSAGIFQAFLVDVLSPPRDSFFSSECFSELEFEMELCPLKLLWFKIMASEMHVAP